MNLSDQAKEIAANHFLSYYPQATGAAAAYDAFMGGIDATEGMLIWQPHAAAGYDKLCELMEKLATDVQQPLDESARALTRCLALISDMMPGVRHIALQDYALLNEAPLEARAVLNKIESKP